MLSSLWQLISGNNNNSAPAAAGAQPSRADGGGLLSFGGQVAYRNQAERRNNVDYDLLFKIVVIGAREGSHDCQQKK